MPSLAPAFVVLGSLVVLIALERRYPLRQSIEPPERRRRNLAVAAVTAVALRGAGRPVISQLADLVERRRRFCSFLALVLRKELEDRLAAAGHRREWADIAQDLERLSETEIEQDGKRYLLRNAAPGCAGTVLRTLGVALPPLVRCAQPPPPPPQLQKRRREPRRRSAKAQAVPATALI